VGRLLPIAALLLVAGLPVAARADKGDVPRLAMFTPPPGAPASNGSSDHAAFSQDNRDVRIVAFDSLANNLVAGDANGRRDVFVLFKQRGAGKMGGRILRVSVGSGGVQANGDSLDPSVDGTTGEVPHCVAFQSTATNLVAGARGGVYLRDLSRRATSFVGAGSSPSIDGRCRAVAFESRGWVLLRDLQTHRLLRIAPGADPDQETDGGGVAYDRGGQVYLQRIARTRAGALVRAGRPVLVSGARGNGASSHPAVDDHGDHVVFQSTATNLCDHVCPWFHGGLSAGTSYVYLRTLRRGHGSKEPRLMIAGAGENPGISRAGAVGVYQSAGSAQTEVYRWHWLPRYSEIGSQLLTAEPPYRYPTFTFNGPSMNPAISSRGNYIAFTSFGTGLFGEGNGPAISDLFMRFIGISSEGLPTG
jgi:hypothetical protein